MQQRLNLEIRKDHEALGIPCTQTQVVLMDGQVALSGLPSTEEIEEWLRRLVKRPDASNENVLRVS